MARCLRVCVCVCAAAGKQPFASAPSFAALPDLGTAVCAPSRVVPPHCLDGSRPVAETMHTSYVSPSARAGLITTPGERLWVSSVIVSRPSLSFWGEGGSPCQPRTFGADAADGLVGSAMRDVDTAESWGRMRQWLFSASTPGTK